MKKRGIYQEEPVFGRTLEELSKKNYGKLVPEFVIKCLEKVENPDNICQQGLYRQCGILSKIQQIRFEVNQGNYDIIRQTKDVHIITGALKLFFRELKEPLIPLEIAKNLWDIEGAEH